MSQDRDVPRVRDSMTRNPETVPADCSIGVALGRMRTASIRNLLVRDGPLVGIVSSRDFARLAGGESRGQWLEEPVSRIMTEDPVTVDAEMPVTDAARLLLETRIDALPVREAGEVVGIFTTADALEALLVLIERQAG
jgi:acetoin utilization protein AcuB